MEMHQIRYFLAVARTLNFTQAADECHVAQPSLSRAIKKLEEEFGGDLFRRERSLTHLTELGRVMLPMLTQSYQTALSAKSLASTFRKGDHVPLRLALSCTIDMRLMIGPLTSLMEALPGVELQFFRGVTREVAERLKSGEFEIGVAGPLESEWDRFKTWPLFQGRFNVVVHKSHPLARLDSVPLRELCGVRILGRPYCDVSERLRDQLSEMGVELDVKDAVASDQDMLALLGTNVGVGIMPTTTLCGEDLRAIPIDGLDFTCPVSLYTVAGRQHTPAAAAMVQLLRAANWPRVLEAASAANRVNGAQAAA